MSEVLLGNKEFEHEPNREVEKKLFPLFPDTLSKFREQAMPIEQIYLSHPDEPFSLRLREQLKDGEMTYAATLKDTGALTEAGLSRLEIETSIDAETYAYYQRLNHTVVRKLRAEPYNNICIDWFENGDVFVEVEHPSSFIGFAEQNQLTTRWFTDITGNHFANNEWRGYIDYKKQNNGMEAIAAPEEFMTEDAVLLAKRIYSFYQAKPHTVVTVAGRSGSGKTTAIRSIQEQLEHNKIPSIVLSTDDYHRGKTWLEHHKGDTWTEWDDPIVYDLEALSHDLMKLYRGETITKRRFDFTTEEPVLEGIIDSAPVILVEGIYARDSLFNTLASIRYEIPTSLATCIGRRLLRDIQERPQFAEPERALRYILEQAEPAWQEQIT